MSTIPGDRSYDLSTTSTWAFAGASLGGVMLLTVGSFQVLQGIAAIVQDTLFVQAPNYIYAFDITAWGWFYLVLGIVSVLVAVGVLMNKGWALLGGIVIAGLSALSNFAFLPYYPLWSIVTMAFAAFVIWALCTQLTNRE